MAVRLATARTSTSTSANVPDHEQECDLFAKDADAIVCALVVFRHFLVAQQALACPTREPRSVVPKRHDGVCFKGPVFFWSPTHGAGRMRACEPCVSVRVCACVCARAYGTQRLAASTPVYLYGKGSFALVSTCIVYSAAVAKRKGAVDGWGQSLRTIRRAVRMMSTARQGSTMKALRQALRAFSTEGR